MNTWLRLYIEILDDPKVQSLEPALFKHWINLLCLAAKYDGVLPSVDHISFALRLPKNECQDIINKLIDCSLIDKKHKCCRPHNWNHRQYKSDSSTDRVKRFRKRRRNVSKTADETDQTRPDTDTDTEKKKEYPSDIPKKNSEDAFQAHGEFLRARITPEQYAKLQTRLNGHLSDFIARFDRWVNEAPEVRQNGVKRKERHAYESILNWFDRDVKEGKIKPGPGIKTEAELLSDMDPYMRAEYERNLKIAKAKSKTSKES